MPRPSPVMMTPGRFPSPAAVTMTNERIEWAMPKNGWITQIIEINAPAAPQMAAFNEKVKA